MDKKLESAVSDLSAKVKSLNQKLEEQKVKNVVSGELNNYFSTHRVGSRSNSDEQRLLQNFGVKSLPELVTTVNVNHPKFKNVSQEQKNTVLRWKDELETARWTQQMFGGEPLDRGDLWQAGNVARVKGVLDSTFARDNDLGAKIKAFGTGNAGEGQEWVPTIIPSRFVEEYELDRKLPGAFKELPMDSKNWNLPVQTDVNEAVLIDEGASLADQNFGTTDIQFQSKKLGYRVLIPEELNEDSAPDILSLSRSELMEAQERAVETAIVNGDLAVTHQDADITAANNARKAWDGFRRLSLANSATVDFTGAGITLAKLDEMRKAMGKFGNNPKELAFVFSPKGYIDTVNIDQVTTVEQYGGQATILNGALAVLRGISVLTSEFIREDVNLAGVHEGVPANDVFTTCHLINVKRFYIGRRRPIRMRVSPDPRFEFDRWQLASYQRLDFKGHAQSATEVSSVLGINIAV